MGYDDDSRAYVVMPSFDTFENYARRVEAEMPPGQKRHKKPTTKRCPVCSEENELEATTCSYCDFEFPNRRGGISFKTCSACQALNPRECKSCQNCGEPFENPRQIEYEITLNDALRQGVIVRGMDISEAETQDGEAMAEEIFEAVYNSGDESLIKILKVLPEESFGRLGNIFDKVKK